MADTGEMGDFMKRKIWSLLLCLVLVCSCFAGCGSKEPNDNKGSSASTTKPEEMVTSQFKTFARKVTDALKDMKASTGAGSSQGTDVKLSMEIGPQLALNYGLGDLQKIALAMTIDSKSSSEMHLTSDLSLNDKSILGLDMISDKEDVYVNLPAYSPDYAKMSLEDASGMTNTDLSKLFSDQADGLPTIDDLIDIWSDFSDDFIDCFEYQEMVKGISIGEGEYAFKGDKYITKASAEDVRPVIEKLVKELKKFPGLQVTTFKGLEELEEITVSYFKNKEGEYAWKLGGQVNGKSMYSVLIFAKKGFQFYAEENEKKDILAYSAKESEKKGKIVLCDRNGDITINYDNYSEDHVDLSMEISDIKLTAKIDKTEDGFKSEFDLDAMGFKASGTVNIENRKVVLSATASYLGMNFGTITLESKSRTFSSYEVPSSSLSSKNWSLGLDQKKMQEDLKNLVEDYPFLAEPLSGLSKLFGK